MRHLRSQNIYLTQFLIAIGLCAVMLVHTIYLISNVQKISSNWDKYFITIDSKEILLSELKANLGYGGLIHNFKNYVLRRQNKYYEKAKENIKSSYNTLERLRSLPSIKMNEVKYLDTIERTINNYSEKLEAIHDLPASMDTKDVDKVAFVSDDKAVEAFTWYENYFVHIKNHNLEKFKYLFDETKESLIVSFILFVLVFLSVYFFISNKLSLNKKLLENNRILKFLQEENNDGWWDYDLKKGKEYLSPKFWKILGYEGDETLLLNWRTFIHPEDLERVLSAFNDVIKLKTDKVSWEYEVRYKHRSGEWLTILSRAKIIDRDKRGKPLRIVGTHSDITSFKKAQDELIIQREKNLNAERLASLGEMAGSIAHELNNPLTIMSGSANMILRYLTKDEIPLDRISKLAISIDETVDRISTVIKGLKNLSRDGSHDEFELFSLSEVLDEVYPVCVERSIRHHIELKFPNTKALSISLYGRKVQISQVFLNLLNNAFDAISPLSEKWIEIKILDEGNKIRILIIDSGLGISKELGEQMMRPFFTTKKAEEGTGIGLSISKNIIENHFGSLYIDFNASHTTFVVDLPKP